MTKKVALVCLLLTNAAVAAPYHRAISCTTANDAFDEGLRLYYAFDVEAAERSFRRVAASCAIAAWGVALALGPNINVPQLADRRAKAKEAIGAALKLPSSGVEHELVVALQLRYAGADIDADNLRYADAMRALYKAHPDDADIAALAAASILDLHPFQQWHPDGTPAAETPELVGLLEAALARHPDHPGLAHYYIHTMESSPHPERALPQARAIGTVMPMQGHLVHMPSHIFLRTGNYAEAAEWNRKAIAADEKWAAAGRAGPLYRMSLQHNHFFLWNALLWLGERNDAEYEAKLLAAEATPQMLSSMPGMEPLATLPIVTRARFSAWRELLALPDVEKRWPFAHGVDAALRVVALARLGRRDDARRALLKLAKEVKAVPKTSFMGANKTQEVLLVALWLARGEVAFVEGDKTTAFSSLRNGIRIEDGLQYDEPPSWLLPLRETLGDRLREAGFMDDARVVYEEDLVRHPNNRWARDPASHSP